MSEVNLVKAKIQDGEVFEIPYVPPFRRHYVITRVDYWERFRKLMKCEQRMGVNPGYLHKLESKLTFDLSYLAKVCPEALRCDRLKPKLESTPADDPLQSFPDDK